MFKTVNELSSSEFTLKLGEIFKVIVATGSKHQLHILVRNIPGAMNKKVTFLPKK